MRSLGPLNTKETMLLILNQNFLKPKSGLAENVLYIHRTAFIGAGTLT